MRRRLLLISTLLALSGCRLGALYLDEGAGLPCVEDAHCAPTQRCVDNRCALTPGPDPDPDPPDDAGPDPDPPPLDAGPPDPEPEPALDAGDADAGDTDADAGDTDAGAPELDAGPPSPCDGWAVPEATQRLPLSVRNLSSERTIPAGYLLELRVPTSGLPGTGDDLVVARCANDVLELAPARLRAGASFPAASTSLMVRSFVDLAPSATDSWHLYVGADPLDDSALPDRRFDERYEAGPFALPQRLDFTFDDLRGDEQRVVLLSWQTDDTNSSGAETGRGHTDLLIDNTLVTGMRDLGLSQLANAPSSFGAWVLVPGDRQSVTVSLSITDSSPLVDVDAAQEVRALMITLPAGTLVTSVDGPASADQTNGVASSLTLPSADPYLWFANASFRDAGQAVRATVDGAVVHDVRDSGVTTAFDLLTSVRRVSGASAVALQLAQPGQLAAARQLAFSLQLFQPLDETADPLALVTTEQSTVQTLVINDFAPRRTAILSSAYFGVDGNEAGRTFFQTSVAGDASPLAQLLDTAATEARPAFRSHLHLSLHDRFSLTARQVVGRAAGNVDAMVAGASLLALRYLDVQSTAGNPEERP